MIPEEGGKEMGLSSAAQLAFQKSTVVLFLEDTTYEGHSCSMWVSLQAARTRGAEAGRGQMAASVMQGLPETAAVRHSVVPGPGYQVLLWCWWKGLGGYNVVPDYQAGGKG